MEKAECIHSIVKSQRLSLFLPSTLHHWLSSEWALPQSVICWTDCWRESCDHWSVIYLLFSPAPMQLDTRSRLFEFLAHGLVSWKWGLFIIDLFEGAEMQIVASLSSKSNNLHLGFVSCKLYRTLNSCWLRAFCYSRAKKMSNEFSWELLIYIRSAAANVLVPYWRWCADLCDIHLVLCFWANAIFAFGSIHTDYPLDPLLSSKALSDLELYISIRPWKHWLLYCSGGLWALCF